MMIFIKKWNAILLVLIGLISVGTVSVVVRRNPDRQTATVPGFGKRIVIDAGHGEPDGGAVGSRGVLEKDLNLAIAGYLQGYLEQSGAEVWLTRSGDAGIYSKDSHTIRQKKRTDLANREFMMNESEADVFVSIHMNHFSDRKYSGPQVFYSKNLSASKALAACVQEAMITNLKPASHREIKPAGKEIYLLKQAKVPSVLVECGFLSNPEEERLLCSEEYQKKVAWAVYCGILTYFSRV